MVDEDDIIYWVEGGTEVKQVVYGVVFWVDSQEQCNECCKLNVSNNYKYTSNLLHNKIYVQDTHV